MLVPSMFTPRHEKSTLFTPFCNVIIRSSSTSVASGLFNDTTTRARSGKATSFTRAYTAEPARRMTAAKHKIRIMGIGRSLSPNTPASVSERETFMPRIPRVRNQPVVFTNGVYYYLYGAGQNIRQVTTQRNLVPHRHSTPKSTCNPPQKIQRGYVPSGRFVRIKCV